MMRFARTRVPAGTALLLFILAGALAGTACQVADSRASASTPTADSTPAAASTQANASTQPIEAPASDKLPVLVDPVNDFANVLDPGQEAEIERMCRTLMAATGDVVIVTTVATFKPYGSIQEYAVKLFENHGRGIGEKGKDNGLLMLLAVQDRQVWIEVGYGLEGFITDGFSGETSRQYMIPYFRQGQYGEGLRVGVTRVIARIGEGRNVSLDNVHAPAAPQPSAQQSRGGRRIPIGLYVFLAIVIFNVLSGGFSGSRRRRRGGWGGGGWSGWSGGVGGFGGGGGSWGGGFGGGGGGFGGFGGGRSGGGGGGGSW
jgi:uncharacterized protein